MDNILPTFYLGILLAGLILSSYFLFIEIKKKRELENNLSILKKRIDSKEASPQDYYSIGSIYLSKKLFDQAILNFSYSLQLWDKTDFNGLSILYNAIGFTYSESGQVDMSIYYYHEATSVRPDYVIALNNLGFSYEKKRMFEKAQDTYRKVLTYDASNTVAQEKMQLISRKIKISG
jgi:tetratricopeptide (TPR) repeat protein